MNRNTFLFWKLSPSIKGNAYHMGKCLCLHLLVHCTSGSSMADNAHNFRLIKVSIGSSTSSTPVGSHWNTRSLFQTFRLCSVIGFVVLEGVVVKQFSIH